MSAAAWCCRGGNSDLQEQMAKFEEEKANWERNKNNMNKSASGATLDAELEETRAKAMQQVDRDILELLPKVTTTTGNDDEEEEDHLHAGVGC